MILHLRLSLLLVIPYFFIIDQGKVIVMAVTKHLMNFIPSTEIRGQVSSPAKWTGKERT